MEGKAKVSREELQSGLESDRFMATLEKRKV